MAWNEPGGNNNDGFSVESAVAAAVEADLAEVLTFPESLALSGYWPSDWCSVSCGFSVVSTSSSRRSVA